MKKATHLVALPVLTALLAACAAPVPVEPPVPVEQGRIDQIEGAATTLASQFVAGLEDDFAEVMKLWEDAHKDELMAGLKDDFAAVEKGMSKVKKEADWAAKLDLAADLKDKVDRLKEKLAEGEPVFRELTYTFRNLDAVELTQENREQYIEQLVEAFNAKKGAAKELLTYELDKPILYQHKRDPNSEGEWSHDEVRPGWDRAGVEFKVSNLKEGISRSSRRSLEDVIKSVTDKNAAGLVVGTPVVGVYASPKPVIFLTAKVEYSSASGTGVAELKPRRVCPDAKVLFDLGSIVKQPNATPYLYEGSGWQRKTSEYKGELIVEADSPDVPWDKSCIWSGGKKATAYLAVLLKEEASQGEYYYVAEYHTMTAEIFEPTKTDGTPPKPKSYVSVVPGRLTKDMPACPPGGPGGWGDARNEFINNVLGNSGIRCTDGFDVPVPLPAG